MSFQATLPIGATSAAITGGTATLFIEDSEKIQNGKHLTAPSVTDFRVRPSMTVKARSGKQQPDGSYSKNKRHFSGVIPKLRADGSIAFNVVRTEVDFDVETTSTELTTLRMLGVAQLSDSEFDNTYTAGTL